ncbi:murein biosynthesis integral membrane protein MurJ [Aneurinibacillus sp. Ricciae_BoGa-3]|uniref:murein biosynthesis integral membrane protein MurJ n=1 Tax=Aneurinibacillus sp. Ricciae_BoGa-3 TaxID=3022697 RepID=UPI0023416A35|nr:murein biosynthesis integral membrane protein MurJ [Aneurinibacillus sp. Ricciae_BoGa-3]WCK53719.1 murein biosynthesis integral membrane protein MurJ [Aneurinibacillus sp. Ricciae_BoGa-3]
MVQSVVRSAAVIMIVTLVGRVIGLVRESLLANQFGLSFQADAYTFAFLTVPNTIFLFVPGALNAIFVPSIKGMLVNNKEAEAQHLFRKMLTFTFLVYLVITILGILFSREIIQIVSGGGYTGVKLEVTTRIMQLMWPSAAFIALIGVFQSTLNAHHQFFIPTLSTVVNSIVVCLAYPLLVPQYGIYGVAIGTTLGFAFAALTMLPSIRKQKYSLKPDLRLNDADMKKIGERFVPIMFGSLITQLYPFIYPVLASGLSDGSLAILRYANNIYQLPMAIFVGTFTLPIFPYLVEYYTNREMGKMKHSLTQGMQYLLILTIPTTVAMVVMGNSLASLLYHFKDSKFTVQDAHITGVVIGYLSLGLFFLAARDLLTRAFYAMENTKITVIAAVAGMVVNIVASVALRPLMGVYGLALGTTIGSFANAVWLAYILRKEIGSFLLAAFWKTAIKTLVGSAVMGGFLYFAGSLSIDSLQLAKLYIVLQIAVGAAVFFASMAVMREPLALAIIERVAGKIIKRKNKEIGE